MHKTTKRIQEETRRGKCLMCWSDMTVTSTAYTTGSYSSNICRCHLTLMRTASYLRGVRLSGTKQAAREGGRLKATPGRGDRLALAQKNVTATT